MFISILQHIPHWVWIVLAVLIAVGVSQSYPRRTSVRRATIVPVAMIVLSLYGVVSVFPLQPAALVAWASGVAVAVFVTNAIGAWRDIGWSASTARFIVPGSWVPMVLILGIFSTKFGVGMTLAFQPGLAADGLFATWVSLAYGVFSGTFLGRAVVMWKIAHQALRLQKAC